MRLVIVDDHPVVREGLVMVLDQEVDIDVVGTSAAGEDAIRLAAELHPDVALLDLKLPPPSGPELIHRLREVSPETRILVLTAFGDDDELVEALRAGASGFMLKDSEPERIVEAARRVHAGELSLSNELSGKLIARLDQPTSRGAEDVQEALGLTDRELEILRLVVAGLTNKEISERVFAAERTVKAHLSSIYRKLDVQHRTAAATKAIALGVVDADGRARG